MKRQSRLITLTGGLLAFFSFVLPWENDYSGIYLANGDAGLITMLFLVSLVVIFTNIYLIYTQAKVNSWIITSALIVGVIGVYSCIVAFSRLYQSKINFVSIAFIASLSVIGATIYMLNRESPWKSLPKLWVIIGSLVGLGCYLILFFADSLNIELNGVDIESIKYGASLTAIGFILAIIGSLCFPVVEKPPETINEQDTADVSIGEE